MNPFWQNQTVTVYKCRFQEVVKDLPADLQQAVLNKMTFLIIGGKF